MPKIGESAQNFYVFAAGNCIIKIREA